MDAFIGKDYIKLNDETIKIEDMDSNRIESFFREHIKEYHGDCNIENEIFIKYAHLYRAIQCLKEEKSIDRLIVSRESNPVLAACFNDVLNNKKAPAGKELLSWLKCHFVIGGTFLYLFFKMMKGSNLDLQKEHYDSFFVSRAKADMKMIKVLKDRHMLRLFDTFGKNDSVYCVVNRRKRFVFLLKAYIGALAEMKNYYGFTRKTYGQNCAIDVRNFYNIRVLHSVLLKFYVEEIIKTIKPKDFYTASNLDRYALMCEKLAKKYHQKLISIPHGIEYGFLLPHCFVGDVFYASNAYAARYLNDLYQTSKFVFDQDTVEKMYRVSDMKKEEKIIVFFTEPKEPHVNVRIIQGLLPFLKSKGAKMKIKLHPVDNLKNYKEIIDEVDVITDFMKAISNAICIARKSTILVEALYNNSIAIAIVENNKDKIIFETIPALHDERIISTDSIDSLLSNLDVILRTTPIQHD